MSRVVYSNGTHTVRDAPRSARIHNVNGLREQAQSARVE